MPTILCNLELFSSIGLTELILDVDHIRRYGFLIVASIIFMGRLSIVLLENTEKFDFNKFAITSAVSFSLIIMNYSYSVYMLNLTAASELVFVYKVISFFNGVISIYIFNSFSTDSKCFEKINFLIINKMLLFFMLYLCMLFINIENSPQDLLKYFYILLSILLTDFVVTKVKKIVGDIKLISFINLKFRKLIYYYVAINLFAAVGVYVL